LKDNVATGCRTCQAVRDGVAAFEDHTPDDDQNLTAAAHVDVTHQRDKLHIGWKGVKVCNRLTPPQGANRISDLSLAFPQKFSPRLREAVNEIGEYSALSHC
jgi:hypothetical protein